MFFSDRKRSERKQYKSEREGRRRNKPEGPKEAGLGVWHRKQWLLDAKQLAWQFWHGQSPGFTLVLYSAPPGRGVLHLKQAWVVGAAHIL